MRATEPFLARPAMRYKSSYIAAMREFIAEGTRIDWNLHKLQRHFDEYIDVIYARAHDPMPGYVPQTDYWLIVGDDEYAGTVSVRHELTSALLLYGGHIGYRIRPGMRRRGYGRLICKLGIEKARALGIQRILITCDDNNIGSYKIIEANGGVLENKVDNGYPSLTRRYWIDP